MQINPQHRRKWIAALSITSLLLGQSRALAVRWESKFDPRNPASNPARGISDDRTPIVIVTWPHSHRLLGVTDGRWPGDPFAGPDVCGDSIHIPSRKGLELTSLVERALRADTQHLETMRKLAIRATDGSLNTGDRAALDSEFQAAIATIAAIADDTTFYDIPVLDGSVDMCVDGVPVFVDLPDATEATLGLQGATFDVTTLTNATAAVSIVDWAIVTVGAYRVDIARDELALYDGPADGGLREQQRVLERMQVLAWEAMDGTLNTGQRMPLDAFYLDDLARIDAIAENVSFHGIDLLDGTVDVGLLGPPPFPVPLFVDLPDTTVIALGLEDTRLNSISNAFMALATVDAALAAVIEHRDRMRDTALDLMN